MAAPSPRVEIVKMKATATCYLSNDPPFYLVLHSRLCGSNEQVTFLQDGYAGIEGYQPINSNQVIQCFDNETGEEVQVVQQGTQPRFLDRSYIQFTTSNARHPYELPFITSSLQPGKKYRLRFRPTRPISHWPGNRDAWNPPEGANDSVATASEIPTSPTATIPWEVADGNDTIMFETRTSQPRTPKVTVSLSAPSTYSLSKPFTFTLTFSTDTPQPITVLAERTQVQRLVSDIEILDATSRTLVGPDSIIVCRDDDEPERKDFLRIDGTYTEHRELDFSGGIWEDMELKVGEEYILRHMGGQWWWTEDPIDEIMAYLDTKESVGLARTKSIEFASAGEVRFKVVE